MLTVAVVALCIACEKIPDEDKLNPDTTFVSAEPDSLNFSYDGGELPVVISSSGTWTLSGNASWCSPSIKSGEDGSTVIFKATAISKNETKERSTSYTLSCGDASTKIIITQSPRPEFYVSAEPDSLNFKNLGGERSLVVSSSGTWELSGECDWCTPSVRSGENGEAIIFTAKAISNTATEDRNTSFTLSCGDATAKITITQLTYQNSYYVSTEPDSLTFKPSGGEFSVKVSSSDTWELSGECDWCTPSAKNGIDGDPITFTVLPQSETATEDRSTTFILKCGHATAEIAITQNGYSVSSEPDILNFYFDGGELSVTVSSADTWELSGECDWCTPSVRSGENGDPIRFTVPAISEDATESRSTSFSIICGPASAEIKITQKPVIGFNDPYFLKAILQNYYVDLNGDSQISITEAEACTSLSIGNGPISDMTEIKYFTNIKKLQCSGNLLSQLDVSRCTQLTYLECAHNQLTQLNVSGCTQLTYLDCDYNDLTQLDVSGCTQLTNLKCDHNPLTQLNVFGCTQLTYLHCTYSQLSQLDVSGCTQLTSLDCSDNQLSQLDVSGCTQLTSLECSFNQLSQLDVSGCTQLTSLHCTYNQLSQLNVSGCTQLTYLSCYYNQLSQLDVSNNTLLTYLNCWWNDLTQLDVSNNTLLTSLDCSNNDLTQLDVSNNTQLTNLGCYNNDLSQLDVSNNTQLTNLGCHANDLSQLDVSNNTQLTNLDCYANDLSQLDVSNNTQLTNLDCSKNDLSQLDVSGCTQLTSLDCYLNQLSQLDVSNNTQLDWFDCSDNPLEKLILAAAQQYEDWFDDIMDKYPDLDIIFTE